MMIVTTHCVKTCVIKKKGRAVPCEGVCVKKGRKGNHLLSSKG